MEIKKDEVIKKLTEKRAVQPCSRCGCPTFTVLDGYSKIMLDKEVDGNIRLGGPFVPVTAVVCTNCGAITMHALGALGLLGKQEEKNESN